MCAQVIHRLSLDRDIVEASGMHSGSLSFVSKPATLSLTSRALSLLFVLLASTLKRIETATV